jgi:GT2 family glycosyltransferase/glycosyltransferase involved in cell wall biosynthesis
MTPFSQANNHLRSGNPAQAIPLYLQALRTTPDLSRVITPGINLARKRHLSARQGQKPTVAVCGWELAHNSAGRAYNLAQMYAAFADTEIIGSYFPKWGREIWQPLGNVEIPVYSFVAEDQTRFVDQALELVMAHPYDVVHLSKPRMPNIMFGLLYKLIWGSTVLMDIDDEELAFVDAEAPLTLDAHLQKHDRLPELTSLEGKEWTRLGVGLASAFDGITVSNPALQKRYGGQIIRHARDEKRFQPSPELSSQSRSKFKVPPDKKVVLFFGTPREHKGLLETARAIAGLGHRDVVFAVVGDFPDPALKQKLQAVKDVEYLFLGNQPVQSIPEVTALGDVCVLLQEPGAMVSNFQIPAKLTDALAMGRTVILQDLPPTADVIHSGAVIQVKDKNALPRALEQALAQSQSAQPDSKARDLFLKEFSFAANTPRLRQTLQTARSAPKPLDTLHPLLQHLAPLAPYCSLAGLQSKPKAPDIKHQVTENAVSIIILTRNAAQHLDNCLNSFIKTNTHNPVELIVIDHASTDNTADVVAKYKKKGDIQYIRRDRNYTFSESCNFGATNARHPYLLFLNNDIIYTADVLPRAIEHIIQNPQTGAVGFRLDDDPSSLPQGETQGVQHTGIEFRWNEKRGYHHPEQIRHTSLMDFLSSLTTYNLQPTTAVTAAALLVRKTDFNALKGFNTAYTYGLEDIDFCLRLGRDLEKKCYCILDMGLQHVEGATRFKGDQKGRKAEIENNHKIFKEKWDSYIRNQLVTPPGLSPTVHPAPPPQQGPEKPAIPRKTEPAPQTLNVLFVLPQTIDGNSGLHVQLHSSRLKIQGVSCAFVVPDDTLSQREAPPDASVLSYTSALSPEFAFPYDIIHAWTPREKVRKVCEALLARRNCPLIIHLEDNEEYLTEVTTGRPFSELNLLPDTELNKLIPAHRYHPRKGRAFLDKADGLTLIINTLDRFNTRNVPSMVLPAPVDERLFYPRPLNTGLLRELDIPDSHVVLTYIGNVHDGNKEEVRELYKAVTRLNSQGCPATLLRTGLDKKGVGIEKWDVQHVKHLGIVERIRVPEVLAAADILVQPGVPGPFNDQRMPSKLPEYFASGRPVVLPKTNLGLQVEHLKEAYVLDRADDEGITKAVLDIKATNSLAGSLAAGGLNFFRCRMATFDSARILNNYYSSLCFTKN